MRARSQSGMTLMELMIVVVILGVLAGISMFAYSAYIRRSRASEATTMLASIANREDAYRSEFGRYASASSSSPAPYPMTSVGLSTAWPTAAPGPTRVPFVTSSMPVEWNQLGFRPTGDVRYRFVAAAGGATDTPPGESGWATNPNRDLWYVTEAYGDLDGDSRISTFRIFSGNGNTIRMTSELE